MLIIKCIKVQIWLVQSLGFNIEKVNTFSTINNEKTEKLTA